MPARVLLVGLDAAAARVVREGLALAGEESAFVGDPAAALVAIDKRDDRLDAVLIADGADDPIALAQAIQARDPEVAVLVVCADEREQEVLRALRFAPLVGPHTTVHARRTLDSLGVEVGEAAEAARRRRRHRAELAAAGRRLSVADEAVLPGAGFLGRLVEAAPIGVVTIDAHGRLGAWNRHAAAVLGIADQRALGAPLERFFGAGPAAELAGLVAAPTQRTTEPPARVLARTTADGREQHLRVTPGPFASRTGEPGAVLLIEDVTQRVHEDRERRRVEDAQRFLAETARLLDAPLEPLAMLRRIASLAVPDRAELCVIDLVAPDGSIEGVAAAVDDDVARALERIRSEYPVRADADHPVARVLATGRSVVLEEMTDETYERIAQGPAHLELMRRLAYHSALVAPLVARGRTLGAISLLYLDERRQYSGDDLEVLEEVARRAALALDNARLYERERRIAETLQRSVLPERLPVVPGLAVAARYEPGEGDVGGDWYDIVTLPDGRVACVVGDIVGRGIEAAAMMGQLRNAVRVYALERVDPTEVVNRVDSLVDTLSISEMATLLYLVFDPESSTVEFASAGHPPPLLLAPDGSTRYLDDGRSGPLGVGLQGSHRAAVEALAPGALLVLYTDGLVERRGEVIDAGLERLARAVAAGPEDLEQLADHVLAELLSGVRSDDVALLALRADEVGARLRVGLPAEPENVSLVRRRLRHWLARHDVPAEDAYDVVIAVGEACANAAEHAYGLVPGPLEIEAAIDAGVLQVVVRDYGSWREHGPDGRGLGLPLMRRTMERVDVERCDGGGTAVRMRRRVAGERTPA